MAWVLVVIVLMPNRIAPFSIDMETQTLCMAAGRAIQREFERDTYGRGPGLVQFTCIRRTE